MYCNKVASLSINETTYFQMSHKFFSLTNAADGTGNQYPLENNQRALALPPAALETNLFLFILVFLYLFTLSIAYLSIVRQSLSEVS